MIEKKKKYKLSDFRYQLPKKFIAQKPKQKRDGAKMISCCSNMVKKKNMRQGNMAKVMES